MCFLLYFVGFILVSHVLFYTSCLCVFPSFRRPVFVSPVPHETSPLGMFKSVVFPSLCRFVEFSFLCHFCVLLLSPSFCLLILCIHCSWFLFSEPSQFNIYFTFLFLFFGNYPELLLLPPFVILDLCLVIRARLLSFHPAVFLQTTH